MAWYDTGTVAVTNGSTIVTGTGTNFIVGAQVGEAFYGPDSKLYEIQTITSATVMVLADAYLGSTQSGQAYQIVPTQSLVADLAVSVTDLISDFADVRDYAGNGKFNDGAVGTPGITFTQDQDNGLYRIGANNWALAAGGQKIVDVSTSGIALPDNGKATFGASDDLQIYHDGTDSFISDQGTGNLKLLANDFRLANAANNELMIKADQSSAVTAYYAGAAKLATTSTGIDVTGTATMDGLSVIGDTGFNTASPNAYAHIVPTDAELNDQFVGLRVSRSLSLKAAQYGTINQSGGALTLNSTVTTGAASGSVRLLSSADGSTTKTLANFANNNDISFYEDTGTTAKLFWDASAESLGIGTSSPSLSYSIDAAKGIRSSGLAPNFTLQETDASNQTWLMASYGGTFAIRDTTVLGTAYPFRIEAATPTSTLHLNSAGNVGIGTSSPSELLHVSGGKALIDITSSVGSYLTFKNYGVNQFSANKNYHEINFITSNVSSETNGGYVRIKAGQEVSGNNNSSYLGFWTAPNVGNVAEAMRIDSAGNVGIGTSSPSSVLHLRTSNDPAITLEDTGFGASATLKGANGNIRVGSTTATHFDIAGTERMRIDSAGRVGIGTSSPAAALDLGNGDLRFTGGAGQDIVWGSASADYAAIRRIDPAAQDVGLAFHTTTNAGSDGAPERMRIDSAGHAIIPNGVTLGTAVGVYNAANTLDDYETGTWTPVLGGGATATNMTGKYTKVGNLVTAYLSLENSTISGTPDYIVSGLPFASLERTPLSVTYYRTFNTACESLGGFVAGLGNTMQFVGMVQGGNWVPSALTAGSTRYLFATAVYQAS